MGPTWMRRDTEFTLVHVFCSSMTQTLRNPAPPSAEDPAVPGQEASISPCLPCLPAGPVFAFAIVLKGAFTLIRGMTSGFRLGSFGLAGNPRKWNTIRVWAMGHDVA